MKRSIVQPTPEPGMLYEWDSGCSAQKFLILGVDAKPRELWLCQAVDLQNGYEVRVAIRKRERFNGWRQVCSNAPF